MTSMQERNPPQRSHLRSPVGPPVCVHHITIHSYTSAPQEELLLLDRMTEPFRPLPLPPSGFGAFVGEWT